MHLKFDDGGDLDTGDSRVVVIVESRDNDNDTKRGYVAATHLADEFVYGITGRSGRSLYVHHAHGMRFVAWG